MKWISTLGQLHRPLHRIAAGSLFAVSLLGTFGIAGCVNMQHSAYGAADGARSGRDVSSQASEDPPAANPAMRAALNRAEQNLEGEREREQYYWNKPYMRSDRDRLEFLALPNFETRQRWLAAKGIQGSATPPSPAIQGLIDSNDLTIGMTKQAVKDSWGEPDLVEVSGNPMYGNERWSFSEQASSTEGYQTLHRMVYFESGRVVGWETK